MKTFSYSRTLALMFLLLLGSRSSAQEGFEKARLLCTLPWDDDWVTSVCFIDNDRLAAGNNLGQILLWNLPASVSEKSTPPPVRMLSGHTNAVNRLLRTPDHAYLISASNDRTIKYWDLRTEPTETGTVVLNARAIDEAVLRKKKTPVPVEVKVKVQQASQTLEGHKDWILGLAMTRNGNTLFSGDDKGQIVVWDRLSGKEKRRWQVKGWVWALAVDAEGKSALISERIHLVFDSGRHAGLKLWDIAKSEVKADLIKDFKGQFLSAAAFSPDGKWLAVGRGGEVDGTNGKVTLLEPATGKKIRELGPGHLNGLYDLAFHPDGKHIFSCGRDTVVKIWRLEDGKHVRDLGTPRGGQFKDALLSLSISPDGKRVATADQAGQVHVWQLIP